MDNNLICLDDLENLLEQLGNVKYDDTMMTDEMKASQQRCEKYIEKHMENDEK